MSETSEGAKRVRPPAPAEAAGLLTAGAFALVIGVVVIVIGVASTGGSYLAGPDIGDLATRTAMVTIGTTIAGAGFIAIVGGLVINGIARVLREPRS